MQEMKIDNLEGERFVSTATTPSLPDSTRMSEQETTPGHSLSTASLMSSRYLKFLIPKLLSVSFSERSLLVESKSNEASQDCVEHPHAQAVKRSKL